MSILKIIRRELRKPLRRSAGSFSCETARMSKPATRDGYDRDQLDRVRRTCLHIATKMGDLLDEIIVVGGLVPYLLVDQTNLPLGLQPHAGTMDLDMGLALGLLKEQRYRELSARLRGAGLAPDVNDNGNPSLQRWTTGSPQPVTVDFLIPPSSELDRGNRIRHLETDLAAIVTRGLELAFADRWWIELAGPIPSGAKATRNVPVCGPGAFTVLKALAFGNRTENKDAYDLFYVWNGLGVANVAESLALLFPDTNVGSALHVIRRDFCSHDGPGPVGVAHFIAGRPDDDTQADVTGLAQALLRYVDSA